MVCGISSRETSEYNQDAMLINISIPVPTLPMADTFLFPFTQLVSKATVLPPADFPFYLCRGVLPYSVPKGSFPFIHLGSAVSMPV
jgi:hypothetical protein